MRALVIARETPDQPGVAALLALADERSALLYPAESRHGLPIAALLAQGVRFFVARVAGRILGCGGYVLRSDASAEMKRVFVAEAALSRDPQKEGERPTDAEQQGVIGNAYDLADFRDWHDRYLVDRQLRERPQAIPGRWRDIQSELVSISPDRCCQRANDHGWQCGEQVALDDKRGARLAIVPGSDDDDEVAAPHYSSGQS